MKKLLTLSFALVCLSLASIANNVTTSNIFLTGQNVASDFTLINYNITWENSWRTNTNENNYDGCWIFAKFRKVNSSNWQHATINYVSPGTAAACGHTQPGGSTILTPADGKGVWMYRSAVGAGTANWANARLRWNYGVDGVLDNDSVEIRLFAVEMVYCPQAAFNLGSGGNETYHFRDGVNDTYFPITSENSIACGANAGNLWTAGGQYWFTGTLPAAYPKGYKAVWCMKYEISQQQYVDFLNSIDYNKYVNKNTYNSYQLTGTHSPSPSPRPSAPPPHLRDLPSAPTPSSTPPSHPLPPRSSPPAGTPTAAAYRSHQHATTPPPRGTLPASSRHSSSHHPQAAPSSPQAAPRPPPHHRPPTLSWPHSAAAGPASAPSAAAGVRAAASAQG